MKTDMELKDDVLTELKWEPSVNEAEIGVIVKDGVITFSEVVPDESCGTDQTAFRLLSAPPNVWVGIVPGIVPEAAPPQLTAMDF